MIPEARSRDYDTSLEPLIIKEVSISEIGLLTMTFSQTLSVPYHLKNLKEKLKEADFSDEADQLLSLSVESD